MGLTLTYPEGGMLVTGGTGNVGGGIVRQLAKAGVPMVFTYQSNKTKADAMVDELTEAGARVVAQQMSMTDEASIEAAFACVSSEYGDIHGVACGAGQRVPFSKLMDFEGKDAEAFFHQDALGYYRVFLEATRIFRARGGGSITCSSSFATTKVLDYDGMSPFSKGAVNTLIRQVAGEEAEHNIRCNGVAIGWIEERSWEQILAQSSDEPPGQIETEIDCVNAIVHRLISYQRIPRAGAPEEAGNLFAFLASDQASYLTGQIIAIDGGLSL